MSYYYTYYIGYKHDNKIYPLGPYDAFGDLLPAYCISRSFASEIYKNFKCLREEEASEELKTEFKYEEVNNKGFYDTLKILPLEKLPEGSPIKSGYFLISDVKKYEEGAVPKEEGLFEDFLSPTVYNAKFQSQMLFGPSQNGEVSIISFDDETEESTIEEVVDEHPVSDYMYYMYIDEIGNEFYEAKELRKMAMTLESSMKLPTNAELIVILIEG